MNNHNHFIQSDRDRHAEKMAKLAEDNGAWEVWEQGANPKTDELDKELGKHALRKTVEVGQEQIEEFLAGQEDNISHIDQRELPKDPK